MNGEQDGPVDEKRRDHARIPTCLGEAHAVAHQPCQTLPVLHVWQQLSHVFSCEPFALYLVIVSDPTANVNGAAYCENDAETPAEAAGERARSHARQRLETLQSPRPERQDAFSRVDQGGETVQIGDLHSGRLRGT